MPRSIPSHRSPAAPLLTIAVDFHGVICDHPEGAAGLTSLDWPEVPGAVEWLRRISEKYRVVIVSARFGRPGGEGSHAVGMAMTWLSQRGIPTEWMLPGERPPKILLTPSKPACVLWIDDRAWRFDGVFPSAEDIASFRPWNRMRE